MKFSLAYVKQNPVMFGTIFVVFGLLLYLMLNKGAPSESGGVPSYISSGPTDAEIAGQVALGQASIAANASNVQANMQLAAIQATNQAQIAAITQQGQVDIALATLGSKVQLESLAVDREISNKTIDATLASQMGQLATTLEMQRDNNKTQAAIYADSNRTMIDGMKVNAALQSVMGAQQAQAFMFSSAVGAIGNLSKGDRDAALISLALGDGSSHGSVKRDIGKGALEVAPPVLSF